MDGDPYARMLALAQGGNLDKFTLDDFGLRLRLGVVHSASPLSLEVAGLVQPRESIEMNEDFRRRIQAGERGVFSAGERVLCLTEDEQTFYLVCKLVDP